MEGEKKMKKIPKGSRKHQSQVEMIAKGKPMIRSPSGYVGMPRDLYYG